MSRYIVRLTITLAVAFMMAGAALAGGVQGNAWTVIEYPLDKEVLVDLAPVSGPSEARGFAKVARGNDQTSIRVEVAGLTGEAANYYLYVADQTGKVTAIGGIPVSDGAGALVADTPSYQFMLVLSTRSDLTTLDDETAVMLRSAVPSGFETVPKTGGEEAPQASTPEPTTTETATPSEDPAKSADQKDKKKKAAKKKPATKPGQ